MEGGALRDGERAHGFVWESTARRAISRQGCRSMAWRQGEAISSCCIVGTRSPARVSSQGNVWMARSRINQREVGNAFRDTHYCELCVHSMLDLIQHPGTSITAEAWGRPSLLWSASSGWWAHLQGSKGA